MSSSRPSEAVFLDPESPCGTDSLGAGAGLLLPSEGYRRALIVFVRFPDDNLLDWTGSWPLDPTESDWDALPSWADSLCEDTGGTGLPAKEYSLGRYYWLMTRGKFDLDSRHSGTVVVLDSTLVEYAAAPDTSTFRKVRRAAFDAIDKLASTGFDFSDFSTDTPGTLDYVMFVFRSLDRIQGCEEPILQLNSNGGLGRLDQSHTFVSAYDSEEYRVASYTAGWATSGRGRVCTADYPADPPPGIYDGCSVSCIPGDPDCIRDSPCVAGGSSEVTCPVRNAGFGQFRRTIAHEIGHGFGLGHAPSLSDWSLMGSGTIMHGWERIQRGWVTPIDLFPGSNTTIRIYDSATRNLGSWSPSVQDSTHFRVFASAADTSQYFLLEVRRDMTPFSKPVPTGTNYSVSGQPGSGLLITHKGLGYLNDPDCEGGIAPTINQALSIESAYGLFDVDFEPNPVTGRSRIGGSIGSPGNAHADDAFNPKRNNAFAPYTCPNTNLFNATGTAQSVLSGLAFLNIREGPDSSLVVDVRWNQPSNATAGNVIWNGQVIFTDDFTIADGDTAFVRPTAKLLFGSDPITSAEGVDTGRVEMLVEDGGRIDIDSGAGGGGTYLFPLLGSARSTESRLGPKPDGTLAFICFPDSGCNSVIGGPDSTFVTSIPPAIGDWYGVRLKSVAGIQVEKATIRDARIGIAMESFTFPNLDDLVGEFKLDLEDNFVHIGFDRDVVIQPTDDITVPANTRIGFAANRDEFDYSALSKYPSLAELLILGGTSFQGIDYANLVTLMSDDPDSAESLRKGDWGGMHFLNETPVNGNCGGGREIEFTMIRDAVHGISVRDTCFARMNVPIFENNLTSDIYLEGDSRIPDGGSVELRAPTRVLVKAGSSTYDHADGESGIVDIVNDGLFGTLRPSGASSSDYVWFLSTAMDSLLGDDWGGIIIAPESEGHIQDADIGFAKRGVYFAAADSAVLLNSKIHHYDEGGVLDWGSDARIEGNAIEFGAGRSAFDSTATGVHIGSSGARVIGNAIGQHPDYGIWFDGTEQHCLSALSPTPPTKTVEIRENVLTGSDEGLNIIGSAGIYLEWLCQNYAATVEADTVTQWSGRGIHVHQSADIDLSCNHVVNNRVGVRYYRTSTKLQEFEGDVWFKQNAFKDCRGQNGAIDDVVGLRFYDRPNSGTRAGQNSFQEDATPGSWNLNVTYLFDADLDVGGNSWLRTNGTVMTDSTEIRATINGPGLGDLYLSPILSSEQLCSASGALPIRQGDQASSDAKHEASLAARAAENAPIQWSMRNPAPNPTKRGFRVSFDVPANEDKEVEIAMFDVVGRKVAELWSGVVPPGTYDLDVGAERKGSAALAPGIYFVRLESSDFRSVRKVLILR